MAVSENTQRALNADNASVRFFVANNAAATVQMDAMRESGDFRMVRSYRWNNGSRARPLWEYIVCGWSKSK